MITCLACLLVLASSGPAVAQTVFDEPFEPLVPPEEINSTYALYVAMTQGLEHAFAGVDSLTRIVGFEDLGMGQEIFQRCEVNPGIPICDEMDPLKLKALEAEGKSGKSSADLAKILTDAADASMGAGMMLEFGIAQEMGVAPTRISSYVTTITAEQERNYQTPEGIPTPEGIRRGRCLAATGISYIRTGKKIEDNRDMIAEEGEDEFEAELDVMAESYISPIAMMTEASCMLLVASHALTAAQGRDPVQGGNPDAMLLAIDQILFHGEEQVGNELAYRLSIETPGLTETSDGGVQFVVDKVDRWIHTEYLAEVKTRISGTITTLPDSWRDQPVPDSSNRAGAQIRQGETRSIFIEKELGDFRWLPGTQMYYPFRNTSRIGGILNEEELEQMREATESLDAIDAQMAAMPPQDRLRMQQMMGPRIAKMRNMVNSGVFEFTQITKRVLVNVDAREALSGKVGYEPKFLIQEIQSNLGILGYYLGRFDGDLSSETIAAIVRYQRDYELAITGRPTPVLARIISATLSAVR